MLKRTLELSHDARQDWRTIWDYGIEHWSRMTAEAYYNKIADRLDALASGALIGFPVLSYPGVLRSLVGSHTVYFRLPPSQLQVVRILHQGMDAEAGLSST